ncbi:MAG: hypothetical protein K6A82_03635 [Prevotella sp.]|nr:hypothetical protein [Prevotella sp.]
MKLWQKITGILILIALSISAIGFWLNGMIDMKYLVDEHDIGIPAETYYDFITYISILLCFSIMLNIFLFISIWRKGK